MEALDRFLRPYASQYSHRGFGQTFVLVDTALPERIIGFYTLAPAQIGRNDRQAGDAAPLPP